MSYKHETFFTHRSFLGRGLDESGYAGLAATTRRLVDCAAELLNYLRNHPDPKMKAHYNIHMADSFVRRVFVPALTDSYDLKEHLKEFITTYRIDEDVLAAHASAYVKMSEIYVTSRPPVTTPHLDLTNRQKMWIGRVVSHKTYREFEESSFESSAILSALVDAADFFIYLEYGKNIFVDAAYTDPFRRIMEDAAVNRKAIPAAEIKNRLREQYNYWGTNEYNVRSFVAGLHKKPAARLSPEVAPRGFC